MNTSKTLVVIFTTFLLFILLLSRINFASGEMQESNPNLTECTDWVNCNPNPPNFDGTCCRICFFKDLGYRTWDCAVYSNDVGFTAETKSKMKKRFLYDCSNTDIRELLILELDIPRK